MVGPWDVLRHRDFALISLATAVSNLGTWMQIGALAVFITEHTGRAGWSAAATTVTYLAAALFTPVGGVFADRHDRRRVVALASVVEAFTGLLLAACFAGGVTSPFVLIALAGVQGLASAIVLPALMALVPDLVPADRIANASFLEAASWNIGRAIGPVLAVVLLHHIGYSAIFVVNAASFLLVGVFAMRARVEFVASDETGSTLARLQLGLHELRTNRVCYWATTLNVIEIAMLAPFIALIPAMAQLVLHAGPRGTGLLFLAQGLGSALGLVVIGSFMHRVGHGRSLVAMALALPLLVCIYAASPTAAFAAVVLLPLSTAHSVCVALSQSYVQQFAGIGVRGRAVALNRSIANGSYAVCSALMGVIAGYAGLRTTLVGGAMLACTFLVWAGFGRERGMRVLARAAPAPVVAKTSPTPD